MRPPRLESLEIKPLWRALAALPFVGMLAVAAVAVGIRSPAPLFLWMHLSIFGALAAWYVARHTALMRRSGEELRVDDAGVWRGATLIAPRDELEQGFVRPDDRHGWVLHLARRGLSSRDLRIAVDDETAGREALRTLGLDASQKTASVRAASGVFSLPRRKRQLLFASPLLFVPLFMLAAKLAPVPGVLGIAVLLPLFASLMLIPSRVDVGVDGVLVRWAGRRRFVPFERLTGVEHFEERDYNKVYMGVRLHLDDGTDVRIVTGQKRFDADASRSLAARIEQALESYRRGAGDVDASVLARRGRDPVEWVRALRALASDAQVGPRRAPVPPERLLRIAVDPAAPPAARASAAIAVAPSMTPGDRARLRVATEATASPKLRVALEAAASGEEATEEALAEVLAELEAEETRRA